MVNYTCDLCGKDTDNEDNEVIFSSEHLAETIRPGYPNGERVYLNLRVMLNNKKWQLCHACAFKHIVMFIRENEAVEEVLQEMEL